MRISREEKAKRLEDWKQSGKSAWAYAKENGINPQTFCGWVKRETQKASCFVEISERVKPKPEPLHEILIEKGDIKIHIPLSLWVEFSGSVMEGLKAAL